MSDISGSTIRTGTIYIGDIGSNEGEYEVTGGVKNAIGISLNNNATEISITIADGYCIPELFFSFHDSSVNADKVVTSVTILKNQTSTNTKILVKKNVDKEVDITLNTLIVKPSLC